MTPVIEMAEYESEDLLLGASKWGTLSTEKSVTNQSDIGARAMDNSFWDE